jgi:hypothetical protein
MVVVRRLTDRRVRHLTRPLSSLIHIHLPSLVFRPPTQQLRNCGIAIDILDLAPAFRSLRCRLAPTFVLRPSSGPSSDSPTLRLVVWISRPASSLAAFFPGMSSSNAPVLPTAIRHSTLFSSSTRYLNHKLLAFAIVALLVLTVAPATATAADIPPRHRQYKYTRTLAHQNVKRGSAARPHQAFGVVSIYVAAVATQWSLTATPHPSQLVAFS